MLDAQNYGKNGQQVQDSTRLYLCNSGVEQQKNVMCFGGGGENALVDVPGQTAISGF